MEAMIETIPIIYFVLYGLIGLVITIIFSVVKDLNLKGLEGFFLLGLLAISLIMFWALFVPVFIIGGLIKLVVYIIDKIQCRKYYK